VNYRSIIAALVAGTMLAGCGQAATASNEASPSSFGVSAARIAYSAPNARTAKLFVANCHDVTAYEVPTGQYLKALGKAPDDGRTLYVTHNGQVLVGIDGGSEIRIYGSKKRRLQNLKVENPWAMTQDLAGDLFVLSRGHAVYEYAPGASEPYDPTPVRTITTDIKGATSIVVDSSGYLYVANWERGGKMTVPVFAPGGDSPTRTISDGISAPYSLALDASGNIYVGNYGPPSTVTVYAAGTTTLTHTITSDVNEPIDLAFDSSGNLYVANNQNYGVSVYAAKTFEQIRSIPTGSPGGLAFDDSGNLYIGNFYANSVSVYPPGSSTPAQTITQNVCYPTDVAIQQ